MSTLVIALPSTPASAQTPCEAVLGSDAQDTPRSLHTTASMLPKATEVVVLVGAAQLSWHRLELPRGTLERSIYQEGSANRLRAVLDGLLEEHLLDEPQDLHLALEPQARSQRSIRVAACNRAWLKGWMAVLEQAGLQVSRIVPECAPDETEQTVCAVQGDAQDLLLCNGPQGCCALPLETHSASLLRALYPAGECTLLAEPGLAKQAEQLLGTNAALQTRTQRHWAAAQGDWDLAQFDLLRTRSARTRKRLLDAVQSFASAPHWRAARWAALALVLANLLGLQAWVWRDGAALQAKRKAIAQVLTSTFADTRLVVDASAQMERAVADLQRASGTPTAASLEAMLQHVAHTYGPHSAEMSGLNAIDFGANELRLKGLGQGPALDQNAARLATQGYGAQVQVDTVLLQARGQP